MNLIEKMIEYDERAIGAYLWGEEGKESGLVGHLPIELSKLLKQFLDADKKNMLIVTVIGKRKREVGLVIPGRYTAMTENKEIIDVLSSEVVKKKEKHKYFELKYEKSVSDFKKRAVLDKYFFLFIPKIQISAFFSSNFVFE